MSCSVCGEELAALATTVAIALAKDMDASTLNVLGNFFNAIGDNLAIIAAQREACKNK